jgi:hypothetical protein
LSILCAAQMFLGSLHVGDQSEVRHFHNDHNPVKHAYNGHRILRGTAGPGGHITRSQYYLHYYLHRRMSVEADRPASLLFQAAVERVRLRRRHHVNHQ